MQINDNIEGNNRKYFVGQILQMEYEEIWRVYQKENQEEIGVQREYVIYV